MYLYCLNGCILYTQCRQLWQHVCTYDDSFPKSERFNELKITWIQCWLRTQLVGGGGTEWVSHLRIGISCLQNSCIVRLTQTLLHARKMYTRNAMVFLSGHKHSRMLKFLFRLKDAKNILKVPLNLFTKKHVKQTYIWRRCFRFSAWRSPLVCWFHS